MAQFMRFIAVFIQKQTLAGLGFDSLVEAADFLFWGYEDKDLTPQGIYDSLTDQVTPYAHAGQQIWPIEEFSIRRVAQTYLDSFRQWRGFLRPDVG